jgi:Sulfotransferase family
MLPNFFVVGAPKAGTTSLYHYLDQHPAIYMSPVKEPAYFAFDLLERKRQLGIAEPDPAGMRAYLDGPMTEHRTGVISDWEQYLKLFKNVAQETAVGEVSGNYLGSSRAPAAIRDRIPEARIVMILRDPVERLFSQHAEAVSHGHARREFLPWVEEQQALEAAWEPRLGAVWNGCYAQHVARYLERFPAQQLRILLYEDYSATPLTVLRDLFTFLDVEPDFSVDISRRHNVTWQPRFSRWGTAWGSWRARLRHVLPQRLAKGLRNVTHRRPRPITRGERARVLEIYDADIRQLQRMLSLDLSAWLRVEPQS